jgi:hypothetical protein
VTVSLTNITFFQLDVLRVSPVINIYTQVILVCLLGGKFSRQKLMLVSQFGLTACLFSMALYFLLGELNIANGIRFV